VKLSQTLFTENFQQIEKLLKVGDTTVHFVYQLQMFTVLINYGTVSRSVFTVVSRRSSGETATNKFV